MNRQKNAITIAYVLLVIGLLGVAIWFILNMSGVFTSKTKSEPGKSKKQDAKIEKPVDQAIEPKKPTQHHPNLPTEQETPKKTTKEQTIESKNPEESLDKTSLDSLKTYSDGDFVLKAIPSLLTVGKELPDNYLEIFAPNTVKCENWGWEEFKNAMSKEYNDLVSALIKIFTIKDMNTMKPDEKSLFNQQKMVINTSVTNLYDLNRAYVNLEMSPEPAIFRNKCGVQLKMTLDNQLEDTLYGNGDAILHKMLIDTIKTGKITERFSNVIQRTVGELLLFQASRFGMKLNIFLSYLFIDAHKVLNKTNPTDIEKQLIDKYNQHLNIMKRFTRILYFWNVEKEIQFLLGSIPRLRRSKNINTTEQGLTEMSNTLNECATIVAMMKNGITLTPKPANSKKAYKDDCEYRRALIKQLAPVWIKIVNSLPNDHKEKPTEDEIAFVTNNLN